MRSNEQRVSAWLINSVRAGGEREGASVSSDNNVRLVYSTGMGRICAQCGLPVVECHCSRNSGSSTIQYDGVVRITLDKKHRRGKMMTIITGAPGDDAAIAEVCRELKKALATGGSVIDRQIELQGDHRERVAAYFAARGVKTKRVGG